MRKKLYQSFVALLSDSYGSQVAGIDLVNGSLTEQIALLNKVSAKEAERFQNENEKGINKATKEMEKKRHTYLGQFYDNGSEESEALKKSLKDLQDTYGDDVFQLDKSSDGITTEIHFKADATTAKEALNDFKTDISDIKKQYGESDVLNLLGDNASVGLSKANKVLDKYGDLYKQSQEAKLVSDDDIFKAPSGKEQTAVKWLNDYAQAVKDYNDALSEGDSDKIKQAATEFNAVDNAVQSLLKNSDMSQYADQFTEVKDQLNESVVSANKFNEALSGNDSSKFGKEVKKNADALKDLGPTDTDFKYAFETDGIQEGEDQINSLVNAALECGLISDTSSGQVSKLVNVLSSLGIISSSAGESVDTTTESVSNAVGTVGHETLSKKDDKGKTEGTLSDDDSPSSSKKTGTGNGKAEVGDKVTFASGVYHGASDGSGRTGNYYLGKQVKIAHINKGAPYPYSIVSSDGKTQLGWVKLNQLKGYASGIMKVPNDQLAWTQEQGEEAIVRNDGSILTPLSRDMSVLNADMTKNLWDFMGNPSGFLNDYSNGEKFGVKNEDYSSSVEIGDITIQCNMPNVQNSKDFLRELTTNKDVEKAIRAMTVDRLNGGSSLKKYKYRS